VPELLLSESLTTKEDSRTAKGGAIMANQWFYSKNGSTHGPVTGAELKALAGAGKLLPTDLIWKEGMPSWQPASKVKGLFSSSSTRTVPSSLSPTPPRGSPINTDVPLPGSQITPTEQPPNSLLPDWLTCGDPIFPSGADKKQVAKEDSVRPGQAMPELPKGGTQEKHQRMQREKRGAIIGLSFGLSLLIFVCCLGVMGGSQSSNSPKRQLKWDMHQLRRDADRVGEDPTKTIFIPSDGSQPIVVPNPYPPP
jgi:hypothetical protein